MKQAVMKIRVWALAALAAFACAGSAWAMVAIEFNEGPNGGGKADTTSGGYSFMEDTDLMPYAVYGLSSEKMQGLGISLTDDTTQADAFPLVKAYLDQGGQNGRAMRDAGVEFVFWDEPNTVRKIHKNGASGATYDNKKWTAVGKDGTEEWKRTTDTMSSSQWMVVFYDAGTGSAFRLVKLMTGYYTAAHVSGSSDLYYKSTSQYLGEKTQIMQSANFAAYWSAWTYAVTLHGNGGTIAVGKDVKSYAYGTLETLPTSDDVSRTHYEFGGWYENETCEGNRVEKVGGIETVVSGKTRTTYYAGGKEFWAKWIPITTPTQDAKDDAGNSITVQVDDQWMVDNGVTTASDLTKTGANDIVVWQSFVLGLDPKDKASQTVLAPVQTSDPETLTLTLGNNFAPKTDAGVDVAYQLGTKDAAGGEFSYGTEQDDWVFTVPLPSSGVKYYSIRAKFYGTPQQ